MRRNSECGGTTFFAGVIQYVRGHLGNYFFSPLFAAIILPPTKRTGMPADEWTRTLTPKEKAVM